MAVYFIRAVGSNRVKIGFTASDPNQRLKQLQTSCADELRVIHLIPDGRKDEERRLHLIFRRSHIRREWFWYRPEIAEYLGDFGVDIPVKKPVTEVLCLKDRINLAFFRMTCYGSEGRLTSDRQGMFCAELRRAILAGYEETMTIMSCLSKDLDLHIPPTDFEIDFLKRQKGLMYASY